MSIPILPFVTSTCARNIMWGNERLTTRDVYGGLLDGYYTPVETYIAQHYSIVKIEEAFTKGWLNQQEHDEIVALMATVLKLQTFE